MNVLSIYGNLVRDPELAYTGGNVAICTFDIAVNRKYKGEEQVSYFTVNAFNKAAELINQYYAKGKPILLTGRLQQERWQAKDGGNRSKVVIIVDNLTFTGKASQDEQPAPDMGGEQHDPNEKMNEPDADPTIPF